MDNSHSIIQGFHFSSITLAFSFFRGNEFNFSVSAFLDLCIQGKCCKIILHNDLVMWVTGLISNTIEYMSYIFKTISEVLRTLQSLMERFTISMLKILSSMILMLMT